jgi:hypothetical protein
MFLQMYFFSIKCFPGILSACLKKDYYILFLKYPDVKERNHNTITMQELLQMHRDAAIIWTSSSELDM